MGVIPGRAGSTPICWDMIVGEPDVVGQGTWVLLINTSFIYNCLFYNSSGADADNFTVDFRCPAGTYTLRANMSKNTNRPLVDIDVDGSEEHSVDLYAALDVLNIEEVTGLVLAEGAHTLKFRADGKNGSSSSYLFTVEGISLQRTA